MPFLFVRVKLFSEYIKLLRGCIKISTTPNLEEDVILCAKCQAYSNDLKSLVRARDLLQKAMNHTVTTAWTGVHQVAPAALNVAPPNLPLIQWKGAVFDSSGFVSVDVKHCLKKFQGIMFAHV
jgi:hypothetical protein